MATEVIAFPVNLRKNNNKFNRGYGKYYPEADTKEPLNLKGFAKHIAEHGKLVDYPMAVLVLQNVVSCLKEMVTTGQPVKLDGFGTFTPTIESDGSKTVDSVEGAEPDCGCAPAFHPREREGRGAHLTSAEEGVSV